MRIAIYNRGIPFDAATPYRRPLGGSETSIVHMARELARLGHTVTVYCSLAKDDRRQEKKPLPGKDRRSQTGAPRYADYQEFFRDAASAPLDVVLSFRSFDPFLLGRIAPRMIFWTGDASDQPALKHFEHDSLQQNIDLIFCVSNWHRRSFIGQFNLPPEKVLATRNGFCSELIPPPRAREWTRCAYSSTPFRGLNILLRMFPEMRKQTPDLTLDVFSSMKVYGWSAEADQHSFGQIYQAAAQPGVTWRGSIPQPELMEHLSHTGLLLYPNTFAESSCMAAIEAQACGVVVITTAKAGLTETVEDGKTGICLPGDPSSAEYQREFTHTVSALLQNPARLEELSNAARKRAFHTYRWSSIAKEWTSIFEGMRPTTVSGRPHGPLTLLQKAHDYLENGNVTAVSRVLASLDETPFLKNEVDALKGRLTTWM